MIARAVDARVATAVVRATPAERAVAAATVEPIGLDELMGLAELQTRVDR
jgi:hypothetical protein